MRRKIGKAVVRNRGLIKLFRVRVWGLHWFVWPERSWESMEIKYKPTESAVIFIKCINS